MTKTSRMEHNSSEMLDNVAVYNTFLILILFINRAQYPKL